MKTPRQLKMKKAEVDALIKVRDKLDNGDYLYTSMKHDIDYEEYRTCRKPRFNMARTLTVYCHVNKCGTVGCIGGYMAAEMGVDPLSYMNHLADNRVTDPIGDLFFPAASLGYDHMMPAHAVEAIDNMLETGDPDWGTIMGRPY